MANDLEIYFVTSRLDARALALKSDIWKACCPISQGPRHHPRGYAPAPQQDAAKGGHRLNQAKS